MSHKKNNNKWFVYKEVYFVRRRSDPVCDLSDSHFSIIGQELRCDEFCNALFTCYWPIF